MKKTRFSGALLAALSVFIFLPGTASADPDTTLSLTIEAGENGVQSAVDLQCDPPDGTHPDAKTACAELTLVGGNFDNLPATPELTNCTMEFRPVLVSARGWWEGDKVSWDYEFSNPCTMHAGTGSVFAF